MAKRGLLGSCACRASRQRDKSMGSSTAGVEPGNIPQGALCFSRLHCVFSWFALMAMPPARRGLASRYSCIRDFPASGYGQFSSFRRPPPVSGHQARGPPVVFGSTRGIIPRGPKPSIEPSTVGVEKGMWVVLRWRGPAAFTPSRIGATRRRLNVRQPVFEASLRAAKATARKWEERLRRAPGTALRLLEIAERRPPIWSQAGLPAGVLAIASCGRMETGSNPAPKHD